jgi:ubiquinone/menaquinone biosynthesis C-methylase UbiE
MQAAAQTLLAVVQPSEAGMNERCFNAAHAHRLDDPARRAWLPPAAVLAAMALHSGETVADVGAGTGYFSLPLAQAIGPQGKVYAVDAQDEMFSLLRQKLDEFTLSIVELIRAEADNTGLPASSCDLVFAANVWHEFDDHTAVVREFARVLKAGGRIAILDWRTDVEPVAGPPLEHRLDSSHAMDALRFSGFQKVATANVGLYSWLVQGERKR